MYHQTPPCARKIARLVSSDDGEGVSSRLGTAALVPALSCGVERRADIARGSGGLQAGLIAPAALMQRRADFRSRSVTLRESAAPVVQRSLPVRGERWRRCHFVSCLV